MTFLVVYQGDLSLSENKHYINDVYVPKKTFYNSGSDYSQYKM